MILYLDTSSLVKLYVEEPGRASVRKLVDRAELKRAFDADWPRLLTLEVAEPLAKNAGDLAERHRLSGFDALHLASYGMVAEEFPAESVRFSSAGRALNRAARSALARRQ